MTALKKSSINSLSEKEELLVRKLIRIWKDEEFILGIICTLENDEEVQIMLDYIDSEDEKTPSDLTTKALLIAHDRTKDDIITGDFRIAELKERGDYDE